MSLAVAPQNKNKYNVDYAYNNIQFIESGL
jgi:hypothetical protein